VLVFVGNLSPVPRDHYRSGLARAGRWRELLNTDSSFYGGSDSGNLGGVEVEPWRPAVFGRTHAAAAGGRVARGRGSETNRTERAAAAARSCGVVVQ
jgi:1,4-alpha-glucan branching enzyme